VLLTNADLDHVLGLILLREGGRLEIRATTAVRESLEIGLNFHHVVGAFAEVSWIEPGAQFSPLLDGTEPTGLRYRSIALPGGPPRYLRQPSQFPDGHSIAYEIRDERTGGRLLVASDVAATTPDLESAMDEADAILFDGTFWSPEELRAIQPGARSAAEMGHLPVSEGSLPLLRTRRAQRKIYVHINNTNPILHPDSSERAALDAAGVLVGSDGFSFEL